MFLHLRSLAVGLALAAGSVPIPLRAETPYSEIVVFGDSFSDTGNAFLGTGGVAAAPPYFDGRFCNGPVWVEVLADQLGLSAPAPFLLGGTNYAVGGSETGSGLSVLGGPNVGVQVDLFLEDRGELYGDELVVVLAGGNDLAWQPPYGVAQIPDNLADAVARLAAAGGETFLVPNLYPFGQAPSLRGTPGEVRYDTLATAVNRALDIKLAKLEDELGITVIRFDLALVVEAMLLFPEEFGLTNVTDPACPGCGIGIPAPNAAETMVPNPDEYLWWDFIHMTRAAHSVIGQAAAESVAHSAHP